jgi:hypothetical protein
MGLTDFEDHTAQRERNAAPKLASFAFHTDLLKIPRLARPVQE